MDKYYYLVSSLPFLRFNEKPLLHHKDLLKDCRMWLHGEDMRQMECARIDIENIPLENVSNAVLWDWIIFENTIRNELVRLRASNLGIQPDQFLRKHINIDPTVFNAVRDAAKESSPYKAEMALLDTRWKFLENLEVGHHFNVSALILYALKLQLLERMELFEIGKGEKVFHFIYEGNKDEEERKHRND